MNFLTLDLNLLRVFDEVMAERNLTRAARNLAITQPAASNALRRLRDALGDELVTRAGYGVVPTPFALSIWPAVREALANLRAAIAPIDFDPSTTRDTFVLAMADATAAILIPAAAQDHGGRGSMRLDASATTYYPGSARAARGRRGADGGGLLPGGGRRDHAGGDAGGHARHLRPCPGLQRPVRLRDAPRPSAGGRRRSRSTPTAPRVTCWSVFPGGRSVSSTRRWRSSSARGGSS